MKISVANFGGGVIYGTDIGSTELSCPVDPHAYPVQQTFRENSFMRTIHRVPLARKAITRARKRRMRMAYRRAKA